MTQPLTLGNKLGAISRKIFATGSAVEFTHLMEEFRVVHRDQVLTEAAEMLDKLPPSVGTEPGRHDAIQRLLAARSAQTPQET